IGTLPPQTMVILGSLQLNTGDYRYVSDASYGDSGIAYRPTLVIVGTPPLATMVFLGSQPSKRMKYDL
ncbi:TPA: hypothetical protein ACPVZG_004228, partial [Vibrio parahaemolyticus]